MSRTHAYENVTPKLSDNLNTTNLKWTTLTYKIQVSRYQLQLEVSTSDYCIKNLQLLQNWILYVSAKIGCTYMRSPWNMWSDVTFMSVNPLMPLSQLPKSCFGKVCVELYSLVTWHGWFSNLERNGICFDIEYRHTFELLTNVYIIRSVFCTIFHIIGSYLYLIIIVRFSVLNLFFSRYLIHNRILSHTFI